MCFFGVSSRGGDYYGRPYGYGYHRDWGYRRGYDRDWEARRYWRWRNHDGYWRDERRWNGAWRRDCWRECIGAGLFGSVAEPC